MFCLLDVDEWIYMELAMLFGQNREQMRNLELKKQKNSNENRKKFSENLYMTKKQRKVNDPI